MFNKGPWYAQNIFPNTCTVLYLIISLTPKEMNWNIPIVEEVDTEERETQFLQYHPIFSRETTTVIQGSWVKSES